VVIHGCKGHGFHIGCLKACVDKNGSLKCPNCQQQYGAPLCGNMPANGTMQVTKSRSKLPGYRCGTLQIDYNFQDGTQGAEHPQPGQHYRGTDRTAYLPDNSAGKKVLALLKVAFQRRVTFQVAESVTLGPSAGIRVVWNGIHHKTEFSGAHGYPDAGYLARVTDELKGFGIE